MSDSVDRERWTSDVRFTLAVERVAATFSSLRRVFERIKVQATEEVAGGRGSDDAGLAVRGRLGGGDHCREEKFGKVVVSYRHGWWNALDGMREDVPRTFVPNWGSYPSAVSRSTGGNMTPLADDLSCLHTVYSISNGLLTHY